MSTFVCLKTHWKDLLIHLLYCMCKSIVDQINILDVNDLCEKDFGKVVQLSSLTLIQGVTNHAYQMSIDCHIQWKIMIFHWKSQWDFHWKSQWNFTGNPSGISVEIPVGSQWDPSGQWKNSVGSHNFLPVESHWNFGGNPSWISTEIPLEENCGILLNSSSGIPCGKSSGISLGLPTQFLLGDIYIYLSIPWPLCRYKDWKCI